MRWRSSVSRSPVPVPGRGHRRGAGNLGRVRVRTPIAARTSFVFAASLAGLLPCAGALGYVELATPCARQRKRVEYRHQLPRGGAAARHRCRHQCPRLSASLRRVSVSPGLPPRRRRRSGWFALGLVPLAALGPAARGGRSAGVDGGVAHPRPGDRAPHTGQRGATERKARRFGSARLDAVASTGPAGGFCCCRWWARRPSSGAGVAPTGSRGSGRSLERRGTSSGIRTGESLASSAGPGRILGRLVDVGSTLAHLGHRIGSPWDPGGGPDRTASWPRPGDAHERRALGARARRRSRRWFGVALVLGWIYFKPQCVEPLAQSGARVRRPAARAQESGEGDTPKKPVNP